MRGLPHYPLPDLDECMALNLRCGAADQPGGQVRRHLDQHLRPGRGRAARAYLAELENEARPAGGRSAAHRRRPHRRPALVSRRLAAAPRALADPRHLHHQPRHARPRPTWWWSSSREGGASGAASACPIRATARARPACWREIEALRAGHRGGADRAELQAAHAAGRRAQRARLRALGPRGQADAASRSGSSPACRSRSRWSPPTRSRLDTPEAMAEAAAANRRPPAAEAEARPARATSSASRAVRAAAPEPRLDRRCQRGLDAGELPRARAAPGRARRRAGRAAAAGGRRRGRCAGDPRAVPRLRRRDRRTTARSLAALVGRYDAVNVKLDKTGGLTEALAMAADARDAGLRRHGRLHGGDLARHGAGACCWREGADYVDLDGPLLLAEDRAGAALRRQHDPCRPSAELWG